MNICLLGVPLQRPEFLHLVVLSAGVFPLLNLLDHPVLALLILKATRGSTRLLVKLMRVILEQVVVVLGLTSISWSAPWS